MKSLRQTIALAAGLMAAGVASLVGGAPMPLMAQDAATQRAVLVTGASSGIGRKTAEVLAANGFYVYAGARKQADLDELSAIENVEGIRLDVNVQGEIDAAVETVRAGGRGLYGLINNAGVLIIAPLIEVTEEDLAFQMNVNVYGPYRVTKAFAPLIIESEGRISTTGSISGFGTWGLGGPYTMSKFAVEAYTDVLAREMAPFDVAVSVVEPGNYHSKIAANMVERMQARGYTTEGSLYQDRLDQIYGSIIEGLDEVTEKEPDEVAAAFLDFLTAENPRRRYLVVPNQGEADWAIKAAVVRLLQLNGDQPYAYTRDELVALIDEVLTEE